MRTPAVTVTVLGGPTVLLEVAGVRLLTDPTFDPAGTRYPLPGGALTKRRGPALPAAALGAVDAVLLSHDQHPDNLDRAGRALLADAPAVLTTPAAAGRLGGAAVGLPPGAHAAVAGRVTVTATRAAHGPGPLGAALGEVTGFLIRPFAPAPTAGPAPAHPPAVWVSGDTVDPATAAEVAAGAPVGLAVLHAGAARLAPFGPATLSFTAEQAVRAARLLGDCPVVVVHDDGWSHFTEGPADVSAAFTRHGLAHRLLTPTPGRPVTVAPPG
ncbi:MBL fold metallo-hydrolase [Micromonospora chersina]|uniref:MBL fold metallo-hydrolase n=1 Tax=Micromonospora chersina TaxID=47854 RepID=UPI0033E684E7